VVITILESHVEPDMVPALLAAYQNGLSHLPPQMIRTFLAHSAADKTLWRIVSVWKSREALEEMRHSRETPEGILMFRAAGAEDPQLSIFDVAAYAP
jgi:heme-degrading monooxygenase HmoA